MLVYRAAGAAALRELWHVLYSLSWSTRNHLCRTRARAILPDRELIARPYERNSEDFEDHLPNENSPQFSKIFYFSVFPKKTRIEKWRKGDFHYPCFQIFPKSFYVRQKIPVTFNRKLRSSLGQGIQEFSKFANLKVEKVGKLTESWEKNSNRIAIRVISEDFWKSQESLRSPNTNLMRNSPREWKSAGGIVHTHWAKLNSPLADRELTALEDMAHVIGQYFPSKHFPSLLAIYLAITENTFVK